jgi:uncharacterized glyoxalase superfamily protein PhnB
MTPNVFPALRYRDTEAALGFLTKAFGCTERSVSRAADGSIKHAEVGLGAGIVMFGPVVEAGFLGGGAPDPLASTVSVYVTIADVEAHYEQAKTHGATIVQELRRMDYGSTEYSARDLDGNLWSFGTYDPYAT